jgi:RNA polymerase sigma-70 factor, ECF subfamily
MVMELALSNMNATVHEYAQFCGRISLITARTSVTEPESHTGQVTQLLRDWRSGDEKALDSLLPHVYQELHAVAAAYMRRERPGHTLHPTELIHETYLKLIGSDMPDIENRKHFYALAARQMRQVLVDHARHHRADKRGSGRPNVPLEEAVVYSKERSAEFVALDDALEALAAVDQRKARVIELRFFAGLTVDEIAEVVETSPATVARDLRFAEAWLHQELQGDEQT